MSINVNVQNDLVIVTETSEDITVNVSNAAGPAGVGVPVGGTTGQVLKKFTNTNYDTYWAADASGLTSVGLSMPSAFAVSNSPLTSNGTIAVTGAGTTSQYIRGDGQLANFPDNGGGGSSVNYYLNGSVTQGTFGGITYYEMSKTPVLGAGTNFTRTNAQGNGYIASFITDAGDPSLLNIPGGNWNVEFYFQANSNAGSPQFYAELYKVDASNNFTLVGSGSTNPEGITNGTTIDQYYTAISVPQTSLLVTDRLAIRIYVITSGRTITLHTENSNLCEVLTTFSTGLNALNGLTSQVQYFATGTSGTDFAISSATDTHTFNLPTASATNRGALSSADWSTFSGKVGGSGTSGQVAYWTGALAQTGSNNLFWDAANARLGIGTNAPSFVLDVNGTARVSNDFRVTKGGNNYIDLVANTNTNQAYIDLITSGVHSARLNSAISADGFFVYGGGTIMFGSGTSQTVALKQKVLSLQATNSVEINGANSGALFLASAGDNRICFYQGNTNGYRGNIGVAAGTSYIQIRTGATENFSSGTLSTVFFSTGNVGINTTTDGGQRLQVNGDAYIKGSGATSATTALTVQNSSGTNMFRVLNDNTIGMRIAPVANYEISSEGRFLIRGITTSDAVDALNVQNGTPSNLFNIRASGKIIYGTNTDQWIAPTVDGSNVNVAGCGFIFNAPGIIGTQAAFTFNTAGNTILSGGGYLVRLASGLITNQGTNPTNFLLISPTINQTGTATAISRGLYVNPTLTAAADWRSIEWSNNSGWGLYGAGTANNYLGGALTVVGGITLSSGSLSLPVAIHSVFGGAYRFWNRASNRWTFEANNANIGFEFKHIMTSGNAFHIVNTSDTSQFLVSGAGNTILGSSTDAGFRLDVNGTARVKGQTTITGTTNNDLTNIFRIEQQNGNGRFLVNASGQIIISGDNGQSTENFVTIGRGFNPTSGTTTHTTIGVFPIINQTGGANGITRGLYILPTLTAAADWRAIEVSAGVSVLAPSTTASATLRIPSGTAPTSPVNGDIWFDGTDLKIRVAGVTRTIVLL